MSSPAMPELDARPLAGAPSHPAPKLDSISKDLRGSYHQASSSVDSNLLILFHGLGDRYEPFEKLGQSLNLPQTAVLSLQAPERIPLLLDEPCFQWWPSFDQLGEMIPHPNPTKTVTLLLKLLEHLTSTAPGGPAWPARSIHLFGYAQGATAAGELALVWNKAHPREQLASCVSVSGPLLTHPTTPAPQTEAEGVSKVLVAYRRRETREMNVAGWRRAFSSVREVVWDRGEGMPRGPDEWREVMRFWGQVLTRRSELELRGDVYELAGGVAAATAAGVRTA